MSIASFGTAHLRNTSNYLGAATALEPLGWWVRTDGSSVWLSPLPSATAVATSSAERLLHSASAAERVQNLAAVQLPASHGDADGAASSTGGAVGCTALLAIVTERVPVTGGSTAASSSAAFGKAATASSASSSSATPASSVYVYRLTVPTASASTTVAPPVLLQRIPFPNTPIVKGCVWSSAPAHAPPVLCVYTAAAASLFAVDMSAAASVGVRQAQWQPLVVLQPGKTVDAPKKAAVGSSLLDFGTSPSSLLGGLASSGSSSSGSRGSVSAVCFGVSAGGGVELAIASTGLLALYAWPAPPRTGAASGWAAVDWSRGATPIARLLYGGPALVSLHAYAPPATTTAASVPSRTYWIGVSDAAIHLTNSAANATGAAALLSLSGGGGGGASGSGAGAISMFSLSNPPPLNMVLDARITSQRPAKRQPADTASAAAAADNASPAKSADPPAAAASATSLTDREKRRQQLLDEMTAHQSKQPDTSALARLPASSSSSSSSAPSKDDDAASAPPRAAVAGPLPSLFDIHGADGAGPIGIKLLGGGSGVGGGGARPLLEVVDSALPSASASDFKATTSAVVRAAGTAAPVHADPTAAADAGDSTGVGPQVYLFQSTASTAAAAAARIELVQSMDLVAAPAATATAATASASLATGLAPTTGANASLAPSHVSFDAASRLLAVGSYLSLRAAVFTLAVHPTAGMRLRRAGTTGLVDLPAAAAAASASATSTAAAASRSGVRGLCWRSSAAAAGAVVASSARLLALIGDRDAASGSAAGPFSFSLYPAIPTVRLTATDVALGHTNDPRPAAPVPASPSVASDDSAPLVGTCMTVEKQYFRLTAPPDPATVRPVAVLAQALDRVRSRWWAASANGVDPDGTRQRAEYGEYAVNRLRGIRQDLTLQRVAYDVPLVRDVYETHLAIAQAVGDTSEVAQCQAQLKRVDAACATATAAASRTASLSAAVVSAPVPASMPVASPVPLPVAAASAPIVSPSIITSLALPATPVSVSSIGSGGIGFGAGAGSLAVPTDVISLSMVVAQQQSQLAAQADSIRQLQHWVVQLSQRLHALESNPSGAARKA